MPNTDLEVYIRVRTDASTAAQGITAVISDLQLGTFGALVPDTDTGNNTKTYTINQIPTVGEFTGF